VKRTFFCFMVLWITLGLAGALAETPLGFGYVNTNRTNMRESPGGPIVTRLDDGDAVYIISEKTDSQGRVWYQVNTEYDAERPATLWVQSDYVTAGSGLFSDIVQVAAGAKGMLALKSDGTVVGVADETLDTRVFRDTIAAWETVQQVACGDMTYLALLEDGSLRGFGNMAYEDWNSVRGVRLLDADGMDIAYVTQDGLCDRDQNPRLVVLREALDWRLAVQIAACDFGVVALYPDGGTCFAFYTNENWAETYRGIAEWTDMAAVDFGDWSFTMEGTDNVYLRPLLAGLHRDGTVSTLPENLFPDAEAWTGITDVKAGWDFIIGLRADGTAVCAGGDDALAAQVAGWTDITAVDACMRYCVGLKEDGTLVFAGTYEF